MKATKLIQELAKHISIFGDSEVLFATSYADGEIMESSVMSLDLERSQVELYGEAI